ncbi:MAG: hypothetical protein MSS82_03950 [Bacteroidales bacterium]|nr:hypothetical protein [Bacteroidales bacterium]
MNRFRSIILLTICIGLVYRMACFLMQPDPLQEAVQILPSLVAESVQKSNLPIIRPSAFKAAVPQAATSVAAPSVPSLVAPSVATTSSLTTRSVSGGLAHYAAPVVSDVTNRQHTTVYTYVAAPQHSSSPVSVVTRPSAVRQAAPQRKAPGTIGGTWEDWLNQYYGDTGKENGDLSDLENWWDSNFGGGIMPDNAYDDFYDWAKTQYTPVADANLLLLVLLLLYGVALYKRVRTNKLKDE